MSQSLTEGVGGSYGELAGLPLPEGLVFLFIPSLAALLKRAEELKGSALTEEQVIRIRDISQVVVTPAEVAAAVVRERGYDEVDPLHPWESWQSLRD